LRSKYRANTTGSDQKTVVAPKMMLVQTHANNGDVTEIDEDIITNKQRDEMWTIVHTN
jgi:hypothetical protein